MWSHSSQTKWRAAKPELAGRGHCVRGFGGKCTKVSIVSIISLISKGRGSGFEDEPRLLASARQGSENEDECGRLKHIFDRNGQPCTPEGVFWHCSRQGQCLDAPQTLPSGKMSPLLPPWGYIIKSHRSHERRRTH